MRTLAAPDKTNAQGESTHIPDLVLDAEGNLGIADGIVALRERVTQALRFFRGEWHQNIEGGVPYYRDIFLRRPIPASLVSTILIGQVLTVEGVESVTEVTYNLNPTTRRFTWTARVTGSTGSVRVDTEV